MSFIANICWARPRQPPEYKRFGAIWYEADKHRCSLLLDGIRLGQFFGKPHKHVEAPYLKGDIVVNTRRYDRTGLPQKEYLWVGWIWTDTNQEGVIYNGVIEVDPTPAMIGITMSRILAEWRSAESKGEKYDPHQKSGFFLPVRLEDA